MASTNDLITTVESGKFDIYDPTTVDAVPYYLVCVNDEHRMSNCIYIKDANALISIRARNFNSLRQQKDDYGSSASTERV